MSIVNKTKTKNTIQSTLGKSKVRGGQIGENLFKFLTHFEISITYK